MLYLDARLNPVAIHTCSTCHGVATLLLYTRQVAQGQLFMGNGGCFTGCHAAVGVYAVLLLQTLPLVWQPLRYLRHVSIKADMSNRQLVEVLAPSLFTTRSLHLDMPLGADRTLPDLSACCHLTQLVWTTKSPAAAAFTQAGSQQYTQPDDLLWVLRGCGGLVELTLCGWTWLDARLALALAGAHPCLRRLRLEGCGSLPASSMCGPQERLQRLRSPLRPSLVVEVV